MADSEKEKGFAREVLGGVETIVSSSDTPRALVVHPQSRVSYDDSSSFQYDSANYRLRYLGQEDEAYKFTLALVRARIGRADLDKRIGHFLEDNPGDRINFREVGHNGEDFVIPFSVFSKYRSEKIAHIVLYLVQYLLGKRSVLDKKKEKEDGEKREGIRRKGKGIFPKSGPSAF